MYEENNAEVRRRVQYLLDKRFRIYYVVPFPREELRKATPFRLYSTGLTEIAALVANAVLLPADVREFNGTWATIAKFRCAGAIEHAVQPLYLDSFEAAAPLFKSLPFRCVLTIPSMEEPIAEILKRVPEPWLHLSLGDKGLGRGFPSELSWEAFAQSLKEVAGPLALHTEEPVMRIFEQTLEHKVVSPQREFLVQPRRHGVTLMNEYAAMSTGTIGTEVLKLDAPSEREPYIEAIIASIDELLAHRRWLHNAEEEIYFPNKLCLAASSVTTNFYGGGFAKNNRIKRESPDFHRLILGLVRQESYAYKWEELEVAAIQTDEARTMLRRNAQEHHALVASLAVFAARTLTPVLRLEPKINGIRAALAKVASLARGNNARRMHKTNQAARALMAEMLGFVDARYMEVIERARDDSSRGGVKIVSDLPLEWLPVGKLPLMLAFETSRVTVTPGNVSLDNMVRVQTTYLPVSSFVDILIIRSYQANDPIRDVLKSVVTADYPFKTSLKPKIRIVDVSTPEEFIEAWNEFKGSILIFDGHGRSDPVTGVGQLVIGGKSVTVWELKDKLDAAPPIVILSACDTQPIDSNHATVANTMLMLGAKTVLGTFLPVNAVYAAAFVSRLILRVANYLPTIASTNILRPVTWRSIVNGLQRMAYVTEVMLSISKNALKLSSEAFEGLQYQANVDIEKGDEQWFENFANGLARVTGKTRDEVDALIENWGALVDVMHYVQLGNPELLHIVVDGMVDDTFDVDE